MKTNKSFKKRIKITKKGKALKRKVGQNHFNAKTKRTKQLHQKKLGNFNIKKKKLKQYLPYD